MWPYKCMAVTVTFIDSNKPANSSGALHTVQIAGVHVARARASTHTHTHTGGQLPCASQYATSGGQMPTALAHLKAFCRGDLLFLASVPSV